ncbi:MAG: CHASE2 domain-containing protein, partial [Saezia sp.]
MFWKVLQYWDRRKSRQRWLTFVVCILLFTLLLTMFRGLDQVNWLISDAAARLDGRKPSSDIVIVTIDDDSIRAIGGWPWGREKHASLLNQLGEAGAKVVGLDLIMTGPDMVSLEGDAALRESFSRHNLAVLPIIAYPPTGAGGWMEVEKPFVALTNNSVSLAHINLSPDSDGVARRVYLRGGRDGAGGGVWQHMAAELWLKGDEQRTTEQFHGSRAPADIQETLASIEEKGVDASVMSEGWLRDYEVLIPYVGGARSFKQYSYYDVYFGLVPKEVFRDKYVLVGAVAASGLGDVYSTPILGDDALMPGVEIIANMLDGLLQNEYRYEAVTWQNMLYNLLVIALMIPLFYLAQPRGVLIGSIVLILMNLIWVYLLRRYVGVQVAPAASLITLVLTYPFWAWRRLEQVMMHIRVEFVRMRRENGFFQPPAHLAGDQLERDLQVFESAAWQLRDLQQMVRQSMDTLPYILMLTNERGQVILSNMSARKFFKMFPPLPTMAFEPAMGMEGRGPGMVEAHQLSALLTPSFMGSLSSQKEHNSYARRLLAYMQG